MRYDKLYIHTITHCTLACMSFPLLLPQLLSLIWLWRPTPLISYEPPYDIFTILCVTTVPDGPGHCCQELYLKEGNWAWHYTSLSDVPVDISIVYTVSASLLIVEEETTGIGAKLILLNFAFLRLKMCISHSCHWYAPVSRSVLGM